MKGNLMTEFEKMAKDIIRNHSYDDSVVLLQDKIATALKQVSEQAEKRGRETIEKELMCELRDPCGTIWEHAKKLQDERDSLKKEVKQAREKAIENCANMVSQHWNDSQTMVNQKAQAYRSADCIRSLLTSKEER